jgi:hypothetical protein
MRVLSDGEESFLPGLSDEVETAAQQTPARYSRKAATDIK